MLMMMSVKDYAKKMGCAESTIRKMCAPGGLLYGVSDKIGVGYKIDVEAADAIFRARMERKQPSADTIRKRKEAAFLAMVSKKQLELRREMEKKC